MIRTKRKPRDKSEQMIYNNYQAMQFIREIKDETLTTNIIFELHRILTKDTLDDPDAAGCLGDQQMKFMCGIILLMKYCIPLQRQ